MITLIVARARNAAIGRNGAIPWTVPEDLKSFQRETLGGGLIMGRGTWDSLPVRPLPKRFNIVVSSHPDVAEVVTRSVPEAIAIARTQGYHRIYGIGGAWIYQDLAPLAHRLLISDVDLDVPDADTFFPPLDMGEWTRIGDRVLRAENPFCRLGEYLRRA